MKRFFILLQALCVTVALAADAPPAAPKPADPGGKKFTETIPGTTVNIEMVPIPAGEFKGKDGKAVPVKPIYMSSTEVVWDAYSIFYQQLDMSEDEKAAGVDAKSRPSRPYGDPTHGFGSHDYPAIHITRYAAEQFCVWLSKKTGRNYRLPTEAEWEYACRAGGDGKVEVLDNVAWYWDNSDDKTHPVGKKDANAWGLYDMLGNACEYIAGEGKPVGAGGAYDDEAANVTCTARREQNPDWNSTDPQNPKSRWWLSDGPFVGFRMVCEP